MLNRLGPRYQKPWTHRRFNTLKIDSRHLGCVNEGSCWSTSVCTPFVACGRFWSGSTGPVLGPRWWHCRLVWRPLRSTQDFRRHGITAPGQIGRIFSVFCSSHGFGDVWCLIGHEMNMVWCLGAWRVGWLSCFAVVSCFPGFALWRSLEFRVCWHMQVNRKRG